jgi:hypothetical protein
MSEIFKYIENVTNSNMTELLSILKEQEEIEKICKENSINITLLKQFFLLASKGHNNTEIAQKLGVHRITVQRYSATLREMKQSDYKKIFNFIFKQIVKNEVEK